jgi:hypothetical protein
MTLRTGAMLGTLLGLLLMTAASQPVFLNPSPDAPTSSVHPRLNIGPGGHVFLVWEKERGEEVYDIYFKRSTDAGQTWQQEERWLDQDKPAGSWSTNPQMQSDGKGHVYVVWRTKQQDGQKDVLFTASKDFGATFGPKIKLNRGSGAFAPALSSDGNGHLYVVWTDERPEARSGGQGRMPVNHNLYMNRSDDHGASWLPQDIKLNGAPTESVTPVMRAWPQIRNDSQGHVAVAWFDNRDRWGSIYFRASTDFGKTWQDEQRLKADAPGDIIAPLQMAGDDQGHLYVTWVDNREGEYHIYLVVSADFGRTWSTEARLDSNKTKGKPSVAPTLAADASGRVYVVWQDARHGGWDVYLNVSLDYGKTWRPEDMRLNTGPPGEAAAQFPQIALDKQGNVAVAWQEDRSAEQEEGVYLTWSEDFGTSWHKPDIRVDEPKPREISFRPQIAVLQERTFLLAWESRRQERTDIALKVMNLGARQSAPR